MNNADMGIFWHQACSFSSPKRIFHRAKVADHRHFEMARCFFPTAGQPRRRLIDNSNFVPEFSWHLQSRQILQCNQPVGARKRT